MKCSKCKNEVGRLFCGNCRKQIEEEARLEKMTLIPLLYYDQETKSYRFGCNCLRCPCNRNGVCITRSLNLKPLIPLLHEYDGDNIINQVCG